MPTNGGTQGRRPSTIPPSLPPTVERAYRLKCIQLKRRISDVDDCNDAYRLRKIRLNRGIMKMRLERAFLLEQLAKRMRDNVDESEGSASPPPTPTERPLRTKRGHRKLSIPLSPTLNPTASLRGDPHLHPSTNAIDSPSQQPHLQPYAPALTTPSNATNNTNTPSQQKLPRFPSSKPIPNPATRPPPRPKNAYMIFCDHARDKMRLSNAGVQDFDIHKAMAQEWHDLSDEGQRPYFEIYEQRKEVWEEDMEDFKRRGLVVGGVGAGPVGMLGGGVVEGVRDGGERERMDLGAEGLGEEIGPGEGEGGDEDENGGGDVEMGDGGGFTAVNR